jgi:hypothetical protein
MEALSFENCKLAAGSRFLKRLDILDNKDVSGRGEVRKCLENDFTSR